MTPEGQPPPQWYPPVQPRPQNGMGTAALVLGIVGLVLSLTIVLGLICGLLGLIFGLIGRARARRGEATNGGAATAGVITGSIAMVVAVGIILIFVPNGDYCFHVGSGSNSCNVN